MITVGRPSGSIGEIGSSIGLASVFFSRPFFAFSRHFQSFLIKLKKICAIQSTGNALFSSHSFPLIAMLVSSIIILLRDKGKKFFTRVYLILM